MKTAIPNPIPRIYDIQALLQPNKVLAIFGPRRSGKTTLVKEFLKTYTGKYRFETGDNIAIHEALGSQRLDVLESFIGDNQLIVIDEAHLIPNIGINLKILVDSIPNIRIIITGSSSFDLANQIGEPLVGRKFTYILYPISYLELSNSFTPYELDRFLEKALLFGMYPEVLSATTNEKKIQTLSEITNSYLFKDILIFDGLKNSTMLLNLLRLLAYQVGSEVSLTELGGSLGIDRKTVSRYLNILQQAYIITPLWPYFMNRRKSVMKKNKYYFLDLGVRNTIIGNFNPVAKRDDIGQLWENFLVVERLKKQAYTKGYGNNYFWRTWEQKEIDWVEMRDGYLYGYELTWGKNKKIKNKQAWLAAYPKEAKFAIVNRDNFLQFITG